MDERPEFDLSNLPFEDNGAPTVQADLVHDVVLIGSIALFTTCYLKQTPKGIWYKDCAFYARFPKEAVAPGIILTARKMGISSVVPIIGNAMRSYLWH